MSLTKEMKGFFAVCVAVHNLDEAIKNYQRVGFEVVERSVREEWGLEAAQLRVNSESMIELLSPIADKPVAKIVRNFLEKKGEGVYEVAIAVNDVDAVNRYMKEKGVRVGAEPAPVPPNAYTSANARLMWMSPKTLNGVFLEFIQR